MVSAKVALCLSGQARAIDLCWDYFLKNIIEPTNCDVFVSFANDDSLVKFFDIGLSHNLFKK